MKRIALTIACVVATCCSCVQNQAYENLSAWNEQRGKSVEVIVRSMKRKRSKVDLSIVIKNSYPYTVVIPENSVRFSINNDPGIGNENPRWVLKSGDLAAAQFHFAFEQHEEGQAIFRIEHISHGETTLVNGVQTQNEINIERRGIRGVFRRIAGKSKGTSEEYVRKTAVEGGELPPLEVKIP